MTKKEKYDPIKQEIEFINRQSGCLSGCNYLFIVYTFFVYYKKEGIE